MRSLQVVEILSDRQENRQLITREDHEAALWKPWKALGSIYLKNLRLRGTKAALTVKLLLIKRREEATLPLWCFSFMSSWQVHWLEPLYEFVHAASVAVTLHWPIGGECQQFWLWLIWSDESEFKAATAAAKDNYIQTKTFADQWSETVCKKNTKLHWLVSSHEGRQFTNVQKSHLQRD